MKPGEELSDSPGVSLTTKTNVDQHTDESCSKKRVHEAIDSPQSRSPVKKMGKYYQEIAPIKVSNSFNHLTEIDLSSDKHTTASTSYKNNPNVQSNDIRIPPIFLHNANNYRLLLNDLNALFIGPFNTQLAGNNTKIMLSTIEDYRTMTKYYDEEKIEYHTHFPQIKINT